MKTVVRALPGITDRLTPLHCIYGRSPESNSSGGEGTAASDGRRAPEIPEIWPRASSSKQAINVSHNKMRLERRRYLALSGLLNGGRQHFKSPLRLLLIHD